MKKYFFSILALLFLGTPGANAAELNLMRKWVVFPFDTEPELKRFAEQAWWKSRELLTEKKKYLVASRQFLTEKDVFQSRRTLKPEDVKLLGHLLDADVLVTGYVEKRKFILNVYLTQNGALFWTKFLSFHPSLSAEDQLQLTSERLTQEMMASIPYQAFTIIDPLINKSVYDEAGKSYAIIDVGVTNELALGSDVQWIEVDLPEESSTTPLFGETKNSVFADGKVVKIKREVAVVEILRTKNKEAIKEKTLVRIPKEAEKLAKMFLPTGDPRTEKLAPELLPADTPALALQNKSAHKTSFVFAGILSFLGLIALAL